MGDQTPGRRVSPSQTQVQLPAPGTLEEITPEFKLPGLKGLLNPEHQKRNKACFPTHSRNHAFNLPKRAVSRTLRTERLPLRSCLAD